MRYVERPQPRLTGDTSDLAVEPAPAPAWFLSVTRRRILDPQLSWQTIQWWERRRARFNLKVVTVASIGYVLALYAWFTQPHPQALFGAGVNLADIALGPFPVLLLLNFLYTEFYIADVGLPLLGVSNARRTPLIFAAATVFALAAALCFDLTMLLMLQHGLPQ